MAPEVILNLSYNEKIDIWSLGILSILLATGKTPQSDKSPSDVCIQLFLFLFFLKKNRSCILF